MKELFGKSRGFTLIELLVVIAIIGILSSIVLVSLNNTRQSARDVKRVGDIRQIQLALEIYYDQNGEYPGDASAGACDDAQAAGGVLEDLGLADVSDPGSTVYGYGANAATDATDYVMRATLENTSHAVLDSDEDSTTHNCACDDASGYYCVTS